RLRAAPTRRPHPLGWYGDGDGAPRHHRRRHPLRRARRSRDPRGHRRRLTTRVSVDLRAMARKSTDTCCDRRVQGYGSSVALIAVVVVVLVVFALLSLPVGYNVIGPWRDRRMVRKSDGAFLEHYCRHGSLVRYHRFNRWLPANPRCKLCYV